MKKIFLSSILVVGVLFGESIDLKKGWNLIGTDVDITNLQKFDEASCIDYIWKYNSNDDQIKWLFYATNSKRYSLPQNIGEIKELKKGEGFWVFTDNNCSLDLIDTNTTNINYNDLNITDRIAIRFLNKATFGATPKSVEHLKEVGIKAWLDEQFAKTKLDQPYLREMIRIAKQAEPEDNNYSIEEYLADNDIVFNKKKASFHSPKYRLSAWYKYALNGEDQLRHKVAYALSQIIVESDFEPIFTRRGEALARYFDILYDNAFGNYKKLLTDISFNSGMSMFLTFNGSKKKYQNKAGVWVYPDENYAREIMQLFSMGLNKLNMDGTPIKDAKGNLIPTYTQQDVNELARVFTGWDIKRNPWFGLVGFTRGDLTHPVEFTSEFHDFGEKHLLGETIPANLSGEEDIKKAIDIIFHQSSVAPYIAKNLIMRLTKSNPTPEYVKRVATVFKESNWNLKETVKAIFLDPELLDDLKNNRLIKFKEPQIAYTQFLRAMKVKPLPEWYFCGYGKPQDDNASNCKIVKNSYLFNDTRDFLGQGAGLAPTVFNFYDNDYIPTDPTLQNMNFKAPELQIQSDSVLIKFHNQINEDLTHWDKTLITEQYYKDKDGNWHQYKTLQNFIAQAPKVKNIPVYYVKATKVLIDTKEEFDVLEKVIDGDTNGDFKNLKDWREENYTDDEKALRALIEFEDKKLTGGMLTQKEKDAIYNNLKDKIYNMYDDPESSNGHATKKLQLYKNVIVHVIKSIVTSSKYMVE